MNNQPELRVRFTVDDRSLSELHARSFGQPATEATEWSQRLQRLSVSWIGAFDHDILVGFVHACWDGGLHHAFLLDAVVDPSYQRRGIGRMLVHRLTQEVAESGCQWLHVDYEPHLAVFYEQVCGFRTTHAGLIQLTPPAGARSNRHTGARTS